MPAINITDLNNAQLDVTHIAAIATSTAATATDRLGNVKQTMSGVVASLNAQAAITATGVNAATAQTAAGVAAAARDSINSTGKIFTSTEGTAAGLAATTSGQQFSVVSSDFLTIATYRNNAGAAMLLSSIYTKAYLDSIVTKPVADRSGIVWGVRDAMKRVGLYVTTDGTTWGKFRTIGQVFGVLPIGNSTMKETGYRGIAHAWTAGKQMGLAVRSDARLIAPHIGEMFSGIHDTAGAAVYSRRVAGFYQVFKYDKTTERETQLTTNASNNFGPRFSGDGTRVTFTSDRNDGYKPYYIPVAGGAVLAGTATSDFLLVGDSLTEFGNTGYGNAFALLYPQRNCSNYGIGGQTGDMIAARLGIKAVTFTVAGGSIPASDSVGLTTPNINLLAASGSLSIFGTLAGIPGMLIFTNTGGQNGTYAFQRTTAGSVITAATATAFVPTSGTISPATGTALTLDEVGGRVMLLCLGRNDDQTSAPGRAATQANLAAIISSHRAIVKKFLVLGSFRAYAYAPTAQGGSSGTDVSSEAAIQGVIAKDAALAAIYGDQFIDVHAAMVAGGFTSNYTINGSVYALVNSSYSSDGVHYTPVSKISTAAAVQAAITSKGW